MKPGAWAGMALLLLAAAAGRAQDAQELGTRARDAYTKKDWTGFAEASRALARLEPHSTRALYNLACAESLAGRPQAAIAALETLARMDAVYDLDQDEDLASLRGRADYAAVLAHMQRARTPVATSREAFRLAEKDLLTEGIAHDPRTGRFFLGSVRQRKIVAVDRHGKATDFVPAGRDGLAAVLGLRADPARGVLWACSTAMKPMAGWTAEQDGQAALYAFDLASGALRQRVAVTGPGPHNLNDLTVDPAGRVYASDPLAGTVLALDPGAAAFRTLVAAGTLRSPQGLALSPDGRALYVADYGQGLARVDVASGTVSWVEWPADTLAIGIDGLVAAPGGLVAIQNAVAPARVTRLTLSPDGARITRAQVLDRNHPLFAEPTLGVVVDKDLYYVAASQWPAYEDPDHLPAAESLKPSVVLRSGLR